SSTAGSVINPAYYELVGDTTGSFPVRSVAYDPVGRTAVLTFDSLPTDSFTLRVNAAVRSAAGLPLAQQYTSRFQTLSDFTAKAPPTISGNPTPQATIGQPFTYQPTATDPDGPASALTYLLYSGPSGMLVSAITGVATWTPPAGSPAEVPVTMFVFDGRGGRG